MKRKQALGLILFSILAFGCSSPYGLEEGEGAGAPGQDGGFSGYGDGATYGNNNSFGRGGAGTGDYYNDPQYGVNVVGGLKISEPAADLAVLAAAHSSLRGVAIPRDVVIMGEVGLAGELRPVANGEARI